MAKKPSIASSGGAWCKSPMPTNVAGLATTMPALRSAISAKNMPMPTVMAVRIDAGMPLTIISRSLNTLTRINRQPEMNTAPSATSHDRPMPLTTT